MSAHRFVSTHSLLLATAAASLMASAPAFAQPDSAQTGTEADEANAEQEDADIVVTASLREERLIEVPFSVNAQTEQDIQRSGAVTLEDISRNVAGLAVQNLGPGQSQVSIRGVSAGQVVRDQPGVKEQVGVYLDDSVISLSLFTPDLDLFDLNRVETLRGPQGTLFGSGSVGGTVRYITNQPRLGVVEGLVEANLNLVDGNDLGWALRAAVNMPIGDIAALRVVGYHTEYGGFIDARREGGGIDEDINDGARSGIRVALRVQPTENLSITPRVVFQHVRSNGFNRQEVYNLYANPFTTTRPAVTFREREQFLLLDERFEDDTWIADLTGRFGFGGVELTTVTSYINRDILVSRDASALTGSVTVDLNFLAPAVLLPSNLVDTTDLETFSQEIRLGSATEGPVQWVVGVFYSDTDRLYSQRLPTPGYDAFTDIRFGAGTSVAVANGFPLNSPYNADLPYNIEQQAVFGEASFDISDRFTLTAGGRYYDFSEVREFNSGGLFSNGDNNRDETSSNGFSPRVIATYEIADDVRINAQAAHGFRLGGVNDPLNIPLCTGGAGGIDAQTYGNRPTYEDETLWNYELNVRGQRGGITFHTAAFYTDIRNLQVTADAGSCSSRVVFNVPRAHSMGLEFELSASPARGLGFSLAGSLIEAEFDSSVTTPAGVVVAGMRDGNRLPSVPRFQISANTSYTFDFGDDGDAYVGASFQHVGSRFTQPSDQENNPRTFVHGLPFGGAPAGAATTLDLRLPSYNLLNLSAGIDWDSGFSLMAYVTNVLDENPILAFDRERGGRARLGFHVGQPRTFGITARKRF
jgi:outer membrane receptor protein involved in Fe transport